MEDCPLSFDAARLKEKKPEDGEDSFMVCYSSLMILLLTFMILMVTLAQVKEPRFRKAIGSVKGAFAFLPHTGGDNPIADGTAGFLPEEVPGEPDTAEEEELGAYEQAVQEIKERAGLPELAGLEIEERDTGLAIRVSDGLLFARGSADIREQFKPVLDLVAETIKLRPGKVSVVGHTCDLPIATDAFQSNWELSIVRAVRVIQWLEDRGIDPQLLYAYGLADQQALAPNDGEDNRRRNRRVEIFIANQETQS
jgi:chemotaxis protein MotB